MYNVTCPTVCDVVTGRRSAENMHCALREVRTHMAGRQAGREEGGGREGGRQAGREGGREGGR